MCYAFLKLVEDVAYSNLEFPALAVVVIVVIGLGKVVPVLLIHGEYRLLLIILTFILEDRAIVGDGVNLINTPF